MDGCSGLFAGTMAKNFGIEEIMESFFPCCREFEEDNLPVLCTSALSALS